MNFTLPASTRPTSGIKALPPAAIKYLVVHCSATPATVNWSAADIDRSHRNRGFKMIGYHFVIRRDGAVEAGRSTGVRVAHVGEPEDHNHESLGICMVGGTDPKGKPELNFTDAQFASLAEVLHALGTQFPNAEILGHRDFPNVAKACPCFDVRHWVDTGERRP